MQEEIAVLLLVAFFIILVLIDPVATAVRAVLALGVRYSVATAGLRLLGVVAVVVLAPFVTELVQMVRAPGRSFDSSAWGTHLVAGLAPAIGLAGILRIWLVDVVLGKRLGNGDRKDD